MKIFFRTAPAVIAALGMIAGAWSFSTSAPAASQSPGDTPTVDAGTPEPTEPSAEMTLYPGPETATAATESTPTIPAVGTATTPGIETATQPAATAVSATPVAPSNAVPAAPAQPASPALSFPALQLPGGMPENEKQLLTAVYAYQPDFSAITPDTFNKEDRAALDVMWIQNAATLQMLKLAMNRARSESVRELVRVMGQMHTKDQALIDQFERQVSTCTAGGAGANNAPCSSGSIQPGDMGASGAALSFSKVPVLPQIPLGMLGFKTVDIKGAFMDAVDNAPAAQFDQVFLAQMMAAHGFAIQSAQAVHADASNNTLRDLAGHIAQVDEIHRLLMLQLADHLFYGQNLTIVYPNALPVTGQTPTAIPTASVPATGTPVPTGTAAPTQAAGSAATAVSTGTATPTATVTPKP